MADELNFEEYKNLLNNTNDTGVCRIGQALEIFNGKWRARVSFELSRKETYRFGELKKAIPQVTNTMLTSTLKDLEGMGIVHREQFNEIPPHVEYSLTESGRALLPIFYEMSKWADKYLPI